LKDEILEIGSIVDFNGAIYICLVLEKDCIFFVVGTRGRKRRSVVNHTDDMLDIFIEHCQEQRSFEISEKGAMNNILSPKLHKSPP